MMMLAAAAFLASTALAFYHVGVERHWFAGPSACTGATSGAASVAALQQLLEARQPVDCDVVQWSFMGLSLASLNLIASIMLLALSLQALRGAPRAMRRLPGDPSQTRQVARMIRVDHAGEYGAKRIYEGQLAVLGKSPAAKEIRRMARQEDRHLAAFEALVRERRVRPTALSPLRHAAGYALGAATALMGMRAAMACTVAVEEVIDAHYQSQIETLGNSEPALRRALEEFRGNEIEHRDTARAHGGDDGPPLLGAAVKAGAKLAIWLSTRI